MGMRAGSLVMEDSEVWELRQWAGRAAKEHCASERAEVALHAVCGGCPSSPRWSGAEGLGGSVLMCWICTARITGERLWTSEGSSVRLWQH